MDRKITRGRGMRSEGYIGGVILSWERSRAMWCGLCAETAQHDFQEFDLPSAQKDYITFYRQLKLQILPSTSVQPPQHELDAMPDESHI